MLRRGKADRLRDGTLESGERLRPALERAEKRGGSRIEQVRAARGLVVDDGLALPAAPSQRRGVECVEGAAVGAGGRGGYGGVETLPESVPEVWVVLCLCFANAVPCSVRMTGTPQSAALLMIRRR